MVYVQNTATGTYLSGRPEGHVTEKPERAAWEDFEVVGVTPGMLTLKSYHGHLSILALHLAPALLNAEASPGVWVPTVIDPRDTVPHHHEP